MKNFVRCLFLFVVFCGFNASASLISDEVFLSCSQSSVEQQNCEGLGSVSAIVGDGVEYPDFFNFQNSLSIDVSANSIFVSFENGPYCGWFTCAGEGYLTFLLYDLDWVDMPEGYITGIDVLTNMQGVLTDFGAHSVTFSLPETYVSNDMFLQIDLITDHSEIPEPSILSILVLAMIFGIRQKFAKI